MRKTNWKIILGYVSNKNIGDLITRKDLLDIVNVDRNKFDFMYVTNVDSSRCLLSQVGVLEIYKRGIYIKKKSIKPTWSMFELEKIARSWKGWFMELD